MYTITRLSMLWIFFCMPGMFPLKAQEPINLDITISMEKNDDRIIFLANYFGNQQFIIDTAFRGKDNMFTFKADSALPHGLYIITGAEKNRYFDFVISEDQHFTLHTDTSAFTEKMQITGSNDNTLFFEYINFLNKNQQKATKWQQQIKRSKGDEKKSLQKKLQQLNDKVSVKQAKFISHHPETFTARFIKASLPIEIPDTIEQNEAYGYIQHHYFNRMNLADPSLLRTPLYNQKIIRFLDQYTVQQPDSLIHAVDRVLDLAKKNDETYQYVLWELTRKYESSNIMGFDGIFVHLVDTYFSREEINWLDQTVLKNLIVRSDEIRPLLLGKKAPDMMMLNTKNHSKSLYDIHTTFTLVLFWDTDCGHCKREIPKLKKFYETHASKYNLEVYAICTDKNLEAWRKYISEENLSWINVHGKLNLGTNFHETYDIYSTPTIYLLDKDKKIIAKRVLTDQLKEIIPRLEERKK